MLGTIAVNVCKIFLVLALLYPFYKMLNKKKWQDTSKSESITKRVLYQMHVNGSKVAVIFGFLHGFIIAPLNQTYTITGWLLGIVMVALLATGSFLSIKTKSKPMNRDDDLKWKKLRIFKWILTVLVFLALASHYLLY